MPLTGEDVDGIAQWLSEAYPAPFRMAPYDISIDTREKEYCVIMHDDTHQHLYLIPESFLEHILNDLKEMRKNGFREFEPVGKMDDIIEHPPEDHNYSGEVLPL